MATKQNIVYFDLETQLSAADVGGWNFKCDMRMSVGVIYSTLTGEYQIFDEDSALELIKALQGADLVVGYNHLNFDYAVLERYAVADLAYSTHNLDLMVDVEQISGNRLKLESIATASLGLGKSADGMQALRWWAEYKRTKNQDLVMKIAEYCAFDVKVTKAVHEYGVEHGKILYQDRGGMQTECAVTW